MAKSKLDAYRDLLPDMTDEKLAEITGYKIGTVQKYRAKHAATEGVAEVSEGALEITEGVAEVSEGALEITEGVAEVSAEIEKAASEQDVIAILAALLEKHGVPVTDDRIAALLDTSDVESGVAMVLDMKTKIDADARIDGAIEHLLAEPESERAPKSFATKRTVIITRNGGTMKIGMSEFFGERAASVWAMLSEDDRRDLTKDHVY